jgi:hypothetical protein
MNRKAIIIIVLQAFLIVLLFWFLVFYGKDEYETATSEGEEGIASKLQLVTHNADDQGPATLTLSIASQQQSGIQTAKLTAIQHQSTTISYGTVEAIDNLLDLRMRYLTAIADGNVSRTTMHSAQQNVNRLQLLNQDDKNVSDRVLQEAIGALNNEQAKLAASSTVAKGIHDSLRQQWGATLANWVIKTAANSELQPLLDSREVLLKVTLPFDVTPNKNSLLQIAQIGDQTQLAAARFVSDAPQADSTVQGKTYYYLAPAGNLRAGMRITARMNSKKQASSGVIVPHQATVWFANQAWVYQKLDSEKPASNKFVRRLISTDVEIESAAISGWYNTSGLNAGDELVVNGAQLLLSEELKYQITNENDD